MTNRPLLEDQVRVSKMTTEELVEALMPQTLWQKMSFWLFRHNEFLWTVIRWKWFDIREGSEDADKYRPWYIKLKRKLFGGNK